MSISLNLYIILNFLKCTQNLIFSWKSLNIENRIVMLTAFGWEIVNAYIILTFLTRNFNKTANFYHKIRRQWFFSRRILCTLRPRVVPIALSWIQFHSFEPRFHITTYLFSFQNSFVITCACVSYFWWSPVLPTRTERMEQNALSL